MNRLDRSDRTYRCVNSVGRLALAALNVDVRWSGIEHLPSQGPVVLALNHVSFLDFIFAERAAIERGRHVRFLCRHDAWNHAPVGRLLDGMGHIPVDRESGASAYLRARRLLGTGEAVGLFPEAGISWSWTVRPLMNGAVALARETRAPLVPVALWGGQRIFTVGRLQRRPDLTRGRQIDVSFGTPRHIDPGADLVTETTSLGHTLTALLESLQGLPAHQPRPGEYAEWHPAHLGGHALDRRSALARDTVPRTAVAPTWGPDPEVFAAST